MGNPTSLAHDEGEKVDQDTGDEGEICRDDNEPRWSVRQFHEFPIDSMELKLECPFLPKPRGLDPSTCRLPRAGAGCVARQPNRPGIRLRRCDTAETRRQAKCSEAGAPMPGMATVGREGR
jgi:hypothetical protein